MPSSTSVTTPNAPTVAPDDADQIDLAVVIGWIATDVARYIAGYTVLNDVSARDVWFGDEFDPSDADVALRMNGETKQSSNTEELVFDVGELVEYISAVTTLRPDGVISTDMLGGVGIFREPSELLEPGDRVATEIESTRTLENPVLTESEDE